jgi:hypothetical protein
MGLLYTLTSLGVALFRFASSDLASQSILRNFGVAIFTTIVGLMLRVFIGQFREDPDDLEYEVKEALAATVRQLRADLEQSIAEVQQFTVGARQALSESLTATTTAMAEGVTRFDAALLNVSKRFTDNADAFNTRADTLGASMDRAVGSIESLAMRVDAVVVNPDLVTRGLGSRLIHSQNASRVASATVDRKFLASLSYRVATRRKSLRRQKAFSTRCLSR